MDVWLRVVCAVIELYRIDKPTFDRAAFAARIQEFPVERLGSKVASWAEVLAYCDGRDDHFDDLSRTELRPMVDIEPEKRETSPSTA